MTCTKCCGTASPKKWVSDRVDERFDELTKKLNEQLMEWLAEHSKDHDESDEKFEKLRVHQMRHAEQIEKYLEGFNKILERKL